MTIKTSARLSSVKPSATLAIAAKAAALKTAGQDIINLSVGEPDFDTPEYIKQAAIKAIEAGYTKYTPVSGYLALKQAIINKFKRDNHLAYQVSQILVSTGAKQCLSNLLQAVLNEGDEVIIPAPYWVSYPDMVILNGGKPVIITSTLEQQLKITPAQLEAAITDKTKMVILNSPSNPSGMVYSKAELIALAEILMKYPNIIIATDDIYESILWTDEPFHNIINAWPELYDRTVIINGVSKAYAMTGWRIGYAAGPEYLITMMTKIQSQTTSNPCSISQKAAEAALSGDQTSLQEMAKTFKERHDVALDLLNTLPGFECKAAQGAFYLFPRIQNITDQLPGINDDIEFAEYLLNQAGVAVVPGSAFGMPGYIRLSIALSIETFSKAVEKIKNAIMAK